MADQNKAAKPVARLEEYISDRPYTNAGEKFFNVVILDRAACVDGMELFAAAPAVPAVDAPTRYNPDRDGFMEERKDGDYVELEDVQALLATKDAEVLSLHRQLAAETLRADQGWERAKSKSAECNELRERLAAHPADAGAVAVEQAELIELLKAIRPKFGDVGTRDIEVAAKQKNIDRAIEILASQPRATPLEATSSPPGLTDLARLFADAAENRKQVVLSSNSCNLLYRAMTTSPAEAPAVQMGGAQVAIPDVLFDGNSVFQEVMANDPHTPRPTADNISDVLDALVRLMRLAAPTTGAQVASSWKPLMDSHWVNIVNHDHAYENYTKDDAVHEAVKRTEAKLRELNASLTAPTTESAAEVEATNGSIGDDDKFWAELSMVRLQTGHYQQNKRATAYLVPFIDAWAANRCQGEATSERKPLTDAEIVQRTEDLAAALAKYDGFVFSGKSSFRGSANPRAILYWKQACIAQEILTATDPMDAVNELADEQHHGIGSDK